MLKYGIRNYRDLNLENIENMTKDFDIESFFAQDYRGIAVMIITPSQFIVVNSLGDSSELNHDPIIELVLGQIDSNYQNPRIIYELSHTKVNQSIVQLPCGKNTPITLEMNRLKLYLDSIIRHYKPADTLIDEDKGYIFVKKSDKIDFKKERMIGISIHDACRRMKNKCSKLHMERSPASNNQNNTPNNRESEINVIDENVVL